MRKDMTCHLDDNISMIFLKTVLDLKTTIKSLKVSHILATASRFQSQYQAAKPEYKRSFVLKIET